MTSLLGAFGSGGICLTIALWVILGHRKNRGRLAMRHEHHHTAWWAIVFGVFAAGAGQAFSAPQQVGHAFTQAFTNQTGAFGNVGVGAVAAILTIILFATKPHLLKDAVIGATIPSVYAAAGGLWALCPTVIGSALHGLAGA